MPVFAVMLSSWPLAVTKRGCALVLPIGRAFFIRIEVGEVLALPAPVRD